MPKGKGFVSEAQRRKFYAMARRGEIAKETVERWEEETQNKPLPERAGPKQKRAASVRQRMRRKIRRTR